jgi:DNA-binding NtrC family response regulator
MRAQRMADADVAIAGEDLASHSDSRLLITAGTQARVETIARRIHAAGTRAGLPFIRISAGAFPNEPGMLRATCSRLLEVATGGSLLMSDVETMPRLVQRQLIELLDELELARPPAAAVRLVSGTTVFLFDRVKAGRFSEQLFYRLNVLHLMADNGAPALDRR